VVEADDQQAGNGEPSAEDHGDSSSGDEDQASSGDDVAREAATDEREYARSTNP
jgi:hypothetical protein